MDKKNEAPKEVPPMDENEGLYCVVCRAATLDFYIVRKEILEAAHMEEGYLCLECLEERLGRELTLSDFDTSAPLNRLLIFGYRLGRRASKAEPIPEVPSWPPRGSKVNPVGN